ncbi:MAG: hypothetical protein H7336_13745 [Bacteriovorax sp.]|nr:hypothetical protein [Bacteriovorax sp.]
MRTNLKDILFPLIKTLILLFFLEVMTTSIFPNIGLMNYRIPFNILIVLFLGLRLETPYLAIIILFVQYFHGFFSIEGWEMGTVTGIVICIVVSYVREMIHFSSWGMTILITQVFQLLWFFVQSILIYIQLGSLDYIFEKGWRFLPQSVIIALLSPIFFYILNRIWNIDDRGMLGDKV